MIVPVEVCVDVYTQILPGQLIHKIYNDHSLCNYEGAVSDG